jgi:radical SAM superfamily enzyme YgiQ (UPF0313 family)
MEMSLQPSEEIVGVDTRYQWSFPLPPSGSARGVRSVWYVGLPLTSAHRGGHSGGGPLLDGMQGQERYLNEGTVYPHAALVEMITYQQRCFPDMAWRYIDLSHSPWSRVKASIAADPPDVVAITVYTMTTLWAFIVAAEVKRINPAAVVVFGNDHAGVLYRETLTGNYGRRLVDFVSTGNNAPFTMMGLLSFLQGHLDIQKVPSLAYRHRRQVVSQPAPTFPLDQRLLPDYRLIEDHLVADYDRAFDTWYSQHYTLKRMVTLPLDGGCNWGSRASRRCKHCAIQGLTPKTTNIATAIPVLETIVGDLRANVYATGDSTLGFSQSQWGGSSTYLDEMAEACSASPILRGHRFMLAYGLVYEFLQSAQLCSGFVRTWNVGLEAFDPKLLKEDSKGINRDAERIYQALELARKLDYRLYISGILGLPGTTHRTLHSEVENWLTMAETYRDIITTVSIAPPGLIPGSRMYWDTFNAYPQVRSWHGEILPSRRLTDLYIRENTDVTLTDVEAAINDVGQGVLTLGKDHGEMKFGGHMLGGQDPEESKEHHLLNDICTHL